MLNLVMNVKRKRIEDLLYSGSDAMAELVELYNRNTYGPHVETFGSLEEAKTRTILAITGRYFPETQVFEHIGKIARARMVFEETKGYPRNEVIDECARRGINRATASTQYSLWKNGKK